MSKQVTEADREIIEAWYKEDVESVDAFIEKMSTEYVHDYGTVCHAMAAVAIQAMKKYNRGPQGGITGFQAGAVMWSFIQHWMHLDGPMRLVQYEDMLYPANACLFEKVLNQSTFNTLVEIANKKLAANPDAHPKMIAHWQSIIDGSVPFGYSVKED